MKRLACVVLAALSLAVLAHAGQPPGNHRKLAKLKVTVATADGEPADLWAAKPTGGWAFKKDAASLSYELADVAGIEKLPPRGVFESPATGLTEQETKDLAKHLEPEKGNEPDEAFRKLAASIAPDEKRVIKVARAIFDHVLANMKYDKPAGKAWGRGSVSWACSEKYGNCTDFHALFMNLCRARGIPARFTMGVSLPKEPKGTIEGYHCWCEFYVSGSGWVPVDASDASKKPEKKDYLFGAVDENRIAFVVGRDLTLEPAQKAGPVSIVPIGYAERDGRSVAIKRAIEYEDAR